jgi:type IV secretory pathway VirB10-like protein
MLPLVGIAAALLPDLIKVLAGDKAGTIANDVAKTVQTVTGTSDPVAAKQKLSEDPAAATDLKVKLAQIAVDATKAQNDEQDKARQDQLAQLKEELQDKLRSTEGARATLLELVKDQSAMGWAPGLVSAVVTVGFFGIVIIILIFARDKNDALSNNNLVNITVGALVAAFSTVVNFWLGSSLGSHNKDATNAQIQASQVLRTDQVIQNQQDLQREVVKTSATGAPVPPAAPQPPAAASPPAGAAKQPAAPEHDDFDACVAVTLMEEGGFCVDDGGPTNFGITHRTLADWRSVADCSIEDMKTLTKHEAGEIYRAKYWIPTRAADLPKGVDLLVFDFAVNSGVVTSIKHLQSVVGVREDSSLGPVTLAALRAIDPKELIGRLASDRLEFLRGLGEKWNAYGKGWAKRIEDVQPAALKMAS